MPLNKETKPNYINLTLELLYVRLILEQKYKKYKKK